MKVEQAIYGESRGGHALRLSTGDNDVAARLASRLDLPDTAPPGIAWSPFLSGFPHGSHYILARTILDINAPRAGMVLSHALIVSLDDMVATPDIRALVALLATSPPGPATISTVNVEIEPAPQPQAADTVAAAEALATRGTGPVVRLGSAGFDALIISLWPQLWPAIRRTFAFRLSFGPSDLVESPRPELVCTPADLATRWAGHRIIGAGLRQGPTLRTGAVLSGGELGWPVLQFAREIGANLATFAELPLLERAYLLASGGAQSFEQIVAALRLIDKLSPDCGAGPGKKSDLLSLLSQHVPTVKAREILLLRNFHLVGLSSCDVLWRGVTEWAAANDFSPDDDPEMLSVLENATATSGAILEWREAVLGGLGAAARSPQSAFVNAFWRWAQARPSVIAALFQYLPDTSNFEERLASTAPLELDSSTADTLMVRARSRHWFLLHGALAASVYPPMEAARQQLAADPDTSNVAGLRQALRRATPAEVLACALQLDDPRTAELGAEEVARRPSLLLHADLANFPARAIWARALALNPEAWRGPADPKTTFANVMTDLLDGGPPDHGLIAALASSPLADLSDYSRRSEVWTRVSKPVREDLLAATSAGWLQRAAQGEMPFSPDLSVQVTVLADPNLYRVVEASAAHGITSAVQIVAALEQFGESHFVDWLRSLPRGRALTAADAEAIGGVVLERGWRRAADETVRLVRAGRSDLKPALRVCHSMLGLLTRWSLDVVPPSESEKWELLHSVASDLYPSGPDHEELWDRAGGSNADLQRDGSGLSRWRDALVRMRRGRGMRVQALLSEMRRDYPANQQLRLLASDNDFGTRG